MIVYGKNVAKEVLKNNKKIEKILLQDNFDDKEILQLIENQKIYPQRLGKKEFSKFDKYSSQGIILYIEDFKYSDIEDFTCNDSSVIVILDHLEDPHNLGAIVRTCEAAGVKDIIIPKDRSVKVNSTVMKTSAGCLDRVNIYEVTNLVQTINYLKKNNYWIIGTDMEGTDYKNIDYKGKIVIIIGNEGNGMSRLVKESCDFIATIPMLGEVNSLNASVAAGIIIFETRR